MRREGRKEGRREGRGKKGKVERKEVRREGRKEERKEGRNHLQEYITRCEMVYFVTECMKVTNDLGESFLVYFTI